MVDSLKKNQETRDELGSDTKNQEATLVYPEFVGVSEDSTIITVQGPGDAWIVGDTASNSQVGTSGNNVVGGTYATPTDTFITNRNNVYSDYFDLTLFEDGVNTTATGWGTGTISFTAAQIAQSTTLANTFTISKATLTVDNDSNLTLEMSANGGTNWETVTNGVQKTFSNSGSDLLFRLTAAGVASIENIQILYQ